MLNWKNLEIFNQRFSIFFQKKKPSFRVTRTIKEEHSVEQAMQDVSIETIPVETPEENIIPVEVEMLEEPEQEDQEIFKIPQPKRRKTAEDDRNRKVESVC